MEGVLEWYLNKSTDYNTVTRLPLVPVELAPIAISFAIHLYADLQQSRAAQAAYMCTSNDRFTTI